MKKGVLGSLIWVRMSVLVLSYSPSPFHIFSYLQLFVIMCFYLFLFFKIFIYMFLFFLFFAIFLDFFICFAIFSYVLIFFLMLEPSVMSILPVRVLAFTNETPRKTAQELQRI